MGCQSKELARYERIGGATATWLIALEDSDGNRVEQGDIVSMRFDLWEHSPRRSITNTGAYTTSTDPFPTLEPLELKNDWQTDWDTDSRGYNLEIQFIPPLSDRIYYSKLTAVLTNSEIVAVDALWITR